MFIVIFGLANNEDNVLVIRLIHHIGLVILAPLYIFIFGRAVPLDVKITPEGSAWVNFGVNTVGISELKNVTQSTRQIWQNKVTM